MLAAAWHPHLARADGDPASDVLASQTLFLPQDAGIPHGDQERLASLLNSAQRSGVAGKRIRGGSGRICRDDGGYEESI